MITKKCLQRQNHYLANNIANFITTKQKEGTINANNKYVLWRFDKDV